MQYFETNNKCHNKQCFSFRLLNTGIFTRSSSQGNLKKYVSTGSKPAQGWQLKQYIFCLKKKSTGCRQHIVGNPVDNINYCLC